jgi:hypothetical protein
MALDENKNNPLNVKEIGCVWEKKSASGKIYYRGLVGGKDVVMFKTNARNSKAPSFVFQEVDKDYRDAVTKGLVEVAE